MIASKKQRNKVLRRFPERMVKTSLADYTDLSATYTRLLRHAEGDIELARQLDRVSKHVGVCHSLWIFIRGRRLGMGDMKEMYDRVQEAGDVPRELLVSRRTAESKHKNAGAETELTRLTQMRALAEVWRSALCPDDVPRLCCGDDEVLRKIKVSCGAGMEEYKWRQLFV